MAEIIWTKIAEQDINDIYDYICKDSEVYAQRVTEKIVERSEMLNDFPEAGRMVPEFEDETIRELISGNYRIIYLNRVKKVFILRIHHSARELKSI